MAGSVSLNSEDPEEALESEEGCATWVRCRGESAVEKKEEGYHDESVAAAFRIFPEIASGDGHEKSGEEGNPAIPEAVPAIHEAGKIEGAKKNRLDNEGQPQQRQ